MSTNLCRASSEMPHSFARQWSSATTAFPVTTPISSAVTAPSTLHPRILQSGRNHTLLADFQYPRHQTPPSRHAELDSNIYDDEDPPVDMPWLRSFPLFGFSPRRESNLRYKALSKLKSVAVEHGIDDIHWSDYMRALSVYTALLNRIAKRKLPSQPSESLWAHPAITSGSMSQALPTLRMPFPRELRTRLRSSSLRTLPPESPPFWSPMCTPPRSRSPSPSPSASARCVNTPLPLLDLGEGEGTPPNYARRWSLPSDAVPNLSRNANVEGTRLSSDHVQLLYHMLRHAESIYGLPLTVASSPGISLTRLTDRGIICKRTGVKPTDIIRAEFSAQPFHPAYYVAVDRSINSIVVCVRGTANIVDSLTDAAMSQDPLNVRKYPLPFDSPITSSSCLSPGASMGNLEGSKARVHGFGHAGIIRSARFLFKDIRQSVIDGARNNPGFQVVLTGHSLGAGTASVLALLMRDDDGCPDPFIVAFAPPPCLSYDLAEQTVTLGVTVVNGPDIVPRLSVELLLPLLATARYIADLPKRKKSLLSCGIRRGVIDWDELEDKTAQRTMKWEKIHDGKRLFIPGRVVQLIHGGESSRNPIRTSLRRHDVAVVRVSRAKFLHVRARERGMMLAHATFSYRTKLALALRTFGEKPVPVFKAGAILKRFGQAGNCADMWHEFCRGKEEIVAKGQRALESVVDNLGRK